MVAGQAQGKRWVALLDGGASCLRLIPVMCQRQLMLLPETRVLHCETQAAEPWQRPAMASASRSCGASVVPGCPVVAASFDDAAPASDPLRLSF
mmetsp:Transcript_71800/g.191527  ORF Transcript_71800/g.191527 Transcript_71800/m.191527 type:complete len:94 (-) Transcript_71800:517-798(-)